MRELVTRIREMYLIYLYVPANRYGEGAAPNFSNEELKKKTTTEIKMKLLRRESLVK